MQGDLPGLREGRHRQPLRPRRGGELHRRRPEEAGRPLQRHLHRRARQLRRLLRAGLRGERGADLGAEGEGRALRRGLRPPRREQQHRLQREHGDHLRHLRPEEQEDRAREHGRHPAHRERHHRRGLLHVRRGHGARDHLQGPRGAPLHPGPVPRRVHAHRGRRQDSEGRGQEDLQLQRGQQRQLGQGRHVDHRQVQGGRQALRRALRGLHGVRRAPHHPLRGDLPVPRRQEEREGEAARPLRGLPDGHDHGAGGRRGLVRPLQRQDPAPPGHRPQVDPREVPRRDRVQEGR
mmetsp:Transcript_71581/g.202052  ORF Transcript_71581/g.202052 Transcript_71581/m.202052 type:complete len:292 (+) Transcript_71581:364-1239(+)